MKKLSIIIISYYTKDVLRDCLLNIKDKYENLEVIVVDNNSPDKSADMVEKEFSWVKLIKMTENKGLAYASNVGFEASSGDYILYMGSDAFPKPDTLSGMIGYMESHDDVGAATCKLITRDGSLDMDAHRGFPTPWAAFTHFTYLNRMFPKSSLFNKYFMGYVDMTVPHEIDLCIAHFMLIKRSVFDFVGLWDTTFFLYGEDVDMCYRIKEGGFKIMYLPQWEAIHYKGTGLGVRKTSKDISKVSDDTKKRVRLERARAQEIFYKKHYAKKYPVIVTSSLLFGIKVVNFIRNR